MRAELTDSDVIELMTNPVAEIRAKLATKIASQLATENLTPMEREIAQDILREMALDVSVIVREALSRNIRAARDLPNDVAHALARDVESVALPILEYSPVFSDEDLVELIRICSPPKQVAIGKRRQLSDTVAYALIETENSDAVVALFSNEGADLAERSYEKALDLYDGIDEVKTAMTYRRNLPPVVAERLVTMVTDQLRQHILINHDLPPDLVTDLVIESREQATTSLIKNGMTPYETTQLVSQLYSHGRLTPSLVLRALCIGDMDFCEFAFSHLAAVPLDHARKLIHDPGPLGFEAIYDRAGMPPALLPIFELALRVYGEFSLKFQPKSRKRFCARMIEHVEDEGQAFSQSDRDYLLTTLTKITSAA